MAQIDINKIKIKSFIINIIHTFEAIIIIVTIPKQR